MSIAIEAAGLSETQRQIVDLAREFARTRIEPHAAEWDRTAHFARDVLDELGKLGFLGMSTPAQYDGMGLDTLTYLLAIEELAAADASVAVSVAIHNAIPATMLLRHGNTRQKERWLKPRARGELLAAFALSEPESGSDAASLSARAVRAGDEWVLSGTKAWATNGGTADVMMVMVRTDRPEARRGAKGISTFIVPTDAAGYRPGKPEDKMGLRASNTAAIALEDVRIPADQLLGEEGQGFVYAMEGLDVGRLGIAIQAVGIARRALEHSLAYCAERKQFGQALREFEGVQFKLADMATRVEAARALTHAAPALERRRGRGGAGRLRPAGARHDVQGRGGRAEPGRRQERDPGRQSHDPAGGAVPGARPARGVAQGPLHHGRGRRHVDVRHGVHQGGDEPRHRLDR